MCYWEAQVEFPLKNARKGGGVSAEAKFYMFIN